jgi:hypothetical protein
MEKGSRQGAYTHLEGFGYAEIKLYPTRRLLFETALLVVLFHALQRIKVQVQTN